MFRYRTLRSDIRFSSLPNGTYYFCAQCDLWFNRLPTPPARTAVCRHCGTPWSQAEGIWRKGVPPPGAPPPSRRMSDIEQLLALWFAVSLVLGLGFAGIVYPAAKKFLAARPIWVSLALMSGATAMFFVMWTLLALLLLLFIVAWPSRFNPTVMWDRAFDAMHKQTWRIGLLINLFASVSSLAFVLWLQQRRPDYVDYGLQLFIALLIQMAIARWWHGYVNAIRRIFG